MIILTNTTDKIQVRLASSVATNQMRCYASYKDTTTTTIEPKRNVLNTNNTTVIDLVGGPSSSTQRVVDYINIYNADTSNNTVTILFNDNSTTYNILVALIKPKERIEYQEGEGFSIYSSTGAKKENDFSTSPTYKSIINTVVAGASTSRTGATTLVDITGLNFAVTAGVTYWFRFVICYTTSGTTNGGRFSINGPASPTLLSYQSEFTNATTTSTFARGLTLYDTPAVASANSATTGSNIATIEGFITPSINGTLTGRVATETAAGTITVDASSVVFYQEIN